MSAKDRAKKIKIILFDVDGVLTDGTIWLLPSPAGAKQSTGMEARLEAKADAGGYSIAHPTTVEAKGFHAHDGTAISLARLGGMKLGFVTKRISETVALRARDLRLDFVFQGQANKVAALDEVCRQAGVTYDEVAFLGDDIIDLPIMRRCGLAVAVANAREEVKDEAHFITGHRGGEGAARDMVEFILRAQGTLESAIEQYIDERVPEKAQ